VGRISLAKKFYEEAKNIPEEDGTWLVLYDFKGIKPSTKYWTNLNRLIKIAGSGSLIQYSVFTSKDNRAAAVAKRLAEHYGAETIMYKVDKAESL
jgi:hypothetical protein